MRLVAICGSRAGLCDARGIEADWFDALEDGLTGPGFIAASGADIVIEAGPTNIRTGWPGLAYLTAALSEGRDVIAISKGALVHNGKHLRGLAARSGALLRISGAAAAALPMIDLAAHSLRGSTVLKVEGILNATTNFLLDAMTQRGLDFTEALREAPAKGFAEADPRNDTQGCDTAAKLLILANFGLGLDLSLEDVVVYGIEGVTRTDLAKWKRDGVAPRLVGSLVREGNIMRAEVGIAPIVRTILSRS